MTRRIGPDEALRVVYNPTTGLARSQGASVPLYADPAGTLPADVQTTVGGAVALILGIPTLFVDAFSKIPQFLFPNVANPVVYTSINGGPVSALYPDGDSRLDSLETQLSGTGTISADTLADGTTNKAYLATERTKLSGIATGATANSSDAQLRDRSTHTGTQSADTLTDGTTNKAFLATERTQLSGLLSGIPDLPNAALLTQGLYARALTPVTGSTLGLYALAKDPNVAGRIWVQGLDFSQLGYTDTHGATWVSKAVPPAGASAGVQDFRIIGSFAWLLQGPSAAASGSLWRSPAPDAAGNGLSWTKMFDLAAPPGGITVGDQATWRNSSVAVSGTNVYLLEYSVATITGGPSCYYSPDNGATWTKVKTWANAKHGHAIQVISGVPWVMLGDSGTAFTDIGLWCATTAAAGTWSRKSTYGEGAGGNTWYGINMIAMNVGGVPMIVSEYDGAYNYGPIVYPSQSISSAKTLLPLSRVHSAFQGTMRQIVLTSEGNLMWVHTGEGGAVGPYDSVCISKGPYFTQTVVLESISSTGSPLGNLGNGVEDGAYVWFGKYRCAKEKFIGQ